MSRIPLVIFGVICATITADGAQQQGTPVNWTGFYVGGNLGDSSDSFDFGSTSESFAISGFVGKIPGRSVHGDNSFLAGGQIGYNQQFGKLVLGLEWDTDSISHKASFHNDLFFFSDAFPFGDAVVHANHSAELDLVSTLRVRMGIGWRSLLFYADGGLALGDITSRIQDISFVPPNPGQVGSGSDSDFAIGWAAGGGLEWSITRAVSVAAEYRHVDVGGNYSATSNQQVFNTRGRVDFAADQVALRVNVHLGAFFGH